jgi:Ras-related protein Rab-7A
MLGDKGVGKTSLFGTTMSGNVSHKNEYVGKMPVIVKIWDMNQRELRRMYNKVECCLLIYDMTKATSFHALKAARTEFLAEADLEDPDNFPFVVIGNKVDLHGESKIPVVMASNWCKSITRSSRRPALQEATATSWPGCYPSWPSVQRGLTPRCT